MESQRKHFPCFIDSEYSIEKDLFCQFQYMFDHPSISELVLASFTEAATRFSEYEEALSVTWLADVICRLSPSELNFNTSMLI